MLKLVTIGSLIVCHLYSNNGGNVSNEQQNIKKVLGEIIDITEKKQYYEMIDKKIVKEYNHKFLIVKEKNTNIVYEINSNACMAVEEETEEEKKNRIFGEKQVKKVKIESSYDENGKKIEEKEIASNEKDFMKDVVLSDVKETITEDIAPKIIPSEPQKEIKKESIKKPIKTAKKVVNQKNEESDFDKELKALEKEILEEKK